jgi:hypothetical protein
MPILIALQFNAFYPKGEVYFADISRSLVFSQKSFGLDKSYGCAIIETGRAVCAIIAVRTAEFFRES